MQSVQNTKTHLQRAALATGPLLPKSIVHIDSLKVDSAGTHAIYSCFSQQIIVIETTFHQNGWILTTDGASATKRRGIFSALCVRKHTATTVFDHQLVIALEWGHTKIKASDQMPLRYH
jgi:hypothetical protein